MRRLLLCSTLALAVAGSSLAPLAAKESFPIALTVQSAEGAALPGAAVAIRAESGEPWSAEGKTDRRGRYLTKLPDFSRVYRFEVAKETFATFVQSVDLGAQKLTPGQTAELTITLDPDRGPTPEALYNDGVRAIQAGDFAAAEAKMKETVAAKPDLASAWSVLAMLAADGKRWPEALDAADRTLALAPTDLLALRARVEALGGLGRGDDANVALDALAAADKSKDTARMLFNAGAAAWGVKNAELAVRRFDQALAADPSLHQAHAALAEVKIGTKDLAGAVESLDRALVLDPSSKKLWQRKVEVLKAAGRTEEAAAAEKKLAELP